MLEHIPDEALPDLVADLFIHLRQNVADARRPDYSINPMATADTLVASLAYKCLKAQISLRGIPLWIVNRRVRGASPRTTFRHVRAMGAALLDQESGGATILRHIIRDSTRSDDCASVVVEWSDRYRLEAEHDAFADIRGFNQCG